MASVVAAAPTDGAPLLALHKLDKRFGATHALKVVISKGLNYGVKIFIFDEPTVALDVGAKAEIHRILAFPIREGRGRYHGLVLPAGVYDLADTLHVFRGRADSSEATDTRTLPKK